MKVKNLIKNRKDIPQDLIENIYIKKDGNYLYRIFSFFLYEEQSKYNDIRTQIYNETKNHKNEIKEYFLEDECDDVIVNYKIDNYIEKIKENFFGVEILKLVFFSKIQI